MNRNNIWIRICIAVVLITMAAVWGQIRRWQSNKVNVTAEKSVKTTPKPVAPKRSNSEKEPEVLVKFRPNVNIADIKKIVEKNNDRIEDEIETVKGLYSIDDLDNADAKKVAEQYSQMTDLVLYAEPNFEIKLSDPTPVSAPSNDDYAPLDDDFLPNDPMFAEQ